MIETKEKAPSREREMAAEFHATMVVIAAFALKTFLRVTWTSGTTQISPVARALSAVMKSLVSTAAFTVAMPGKIFFKYSVLNERNYVCLQKGSCNVNSKNRHECPACRYEKCLTKGMKLKRECGFVEEQSGELMGESVKGVNG